MRSTFSGLAAARRGLAAEQGALDLISRNVANANVTGYSRREAGLSAAEPLTLVNGWQIGQGAELTAVLRHRNGFLDRQYRNRAGLHGFEEQRSLGLGQMERILAEPLAGLREDLDEFWASLDDVVNRPGDLDTRVQVRERANTLISHIQSIAVQYRELRGDLNMALSTRTDDINLLSQQVAELNVQLPEAMANGSDVGELLDKRDLLLDRLSKLTGSVTADIGNNQVAVFMGGSPLVYGGQYYPLGKQITGGIVDVLDPLTGQPAKFPGGEMRGLAEVRDTEIPAFTGYLDTLAKGLANRFNQVHQTGYGLDGSTGLDYFIIGPGQLEIGLNPVVADDPPKLAAAANPAPAGGTVGPNDGENARRLAGIRTEAIISSTLTGTSVTVDEYYRSLVGLMGVKAQEAHRRSEVLDLQLQQTDKQRVETSGVSLDEEMTRMVAHQQVYAAVARVITMLDETLDTVVNRMGLSGR